MFKLLSSAGASQIVSYPKIHNFIYTDVMQQYRLQAQVNEKMRSETPETMAEGDREVFIDFREKEEGELKIKLKNLIEREEKVKEEVKDLDDDNMNILRIFIDTISRNNFHRKYKETIKFLKKYHYLKKGDKRTYEFFRMHSIRGWTFPNLFASTYGRDYDGWSEFNLTRIHSFARKQGYITGMASDCCVIPETETKGNHLLKPLS